MDLYDWLSPTINELDVFDGTLTHTVKTDYRASVSTFKALGMVCCRLRSKEPNYKIAEEFGEQATVFGSVVNLVLKRTERRISSYFDFTILHQNPERMSTYCNAVQAKLDDNPAYAEYNVFGFFDGSALSICRPTYGQEGAYDGRTLYHAVTRV